MTIRGIPQGGVPIGMMNAVNGTPVGVDGSSATGLAIGNAQGTFVAPSDYLIFTKLDASNKAVTLPDPAKLGAVLGDSWFFGNAQSGQTLSIFPPTGGNIDGAGVNTAVTCAQGATLTAIVVSSASGASTWLADGGS